jgi:hypothetical protein
MGRLREGACWDFLFSPTLFAGYNWTPGIGLGSVDGDPNLILASDPGKFSRSLGTPLFFP